MKEPNKNKNYSSDYFGWLHTQANLLRTKDFENIDMVRLIEEIESLGNSEKSKLESHLIILFLHMLKMRFQPEKKTRSWELSIKNSRYHIMRTLQKNPSLKRYLPEIIDDAYFSARLAASQETDIEEEIFPEACPWNLNEILENEGKRK